MIVNEYCQRLLRSPGVFHATDEITSEPAYLLEQLGLDRFSNTHDDFSILVEVEESVVLVCLDDDMIAICKPSPPLLVNPQPAKNRTSADVCPGGKGNLPPTVRLLPHVDDSAHQKRDPGAGSG